MCDGRALYSVWAVHPAHDRPLCSGVICQQPIAFPADNLDVYDLCTTEVQKKLKVWRDKHAEDSLSETRTGGGGGGGEGGGGDEASKDAAEAMEVDDPDLAAAIAMSKVSDADTTVGANLPPQFRGMYELYAVVTHKGRNADSGHYMGWVRQSGGKLRLSSGRLIKLASFEPGWLMSGQRPHA